MPEPLPKPLVVGNWKMNGLRAALAEIAAIAEVSPTRDDIWIAPPSTLVAAAVATAAGRLAIGGQDCHSAVSGPHTGCVSAAMLADAGARFVITGHSERRGECGETDAQVRAKTLAARAAGLTAIVCVGENEAERDAGRAEAIVTAQLAASLPDTPDGLVIAYEPVWAIGTGRTPTPAEVAAMHAAIRDHCTRRFGVAGSAIRVLYGGSVTPANAALLLAQPEVAGALVGGASLTASSLLAIARA